VEVVTAMVVTVGMKVKRLMAAGGIWLEDRMGGGMCAHAVSSMRAHATHRGSVWRCMHR
jgi:hypothetical protein